jgi:hypothetical protein
MFFKILGPKVRRKDLGLPVKWERVKEWLNYRKTKIWNISNTDSGKVELKNKNIPLLKDYESKPEKAFWDCFPKKEIPVAAETVVEAEVIQQELEKNRKFLITSEIQRGDRAVEFLKNGAPSYINISIPGCFVENAQSTIRFGKEVTDNIATWISKGYAAGPFDSPPLTGI